MSKSIEVRDLSVAYRDRGRPFRALDSVSFTIGAGEFVSVIGPSGCGKSTLLSVLEGLRVPTGGEVLVGGVPIDGPSPERAVVFQQYSLFPWLTAERNVAFAIEQSHQGMKRCDRLALAREYLAKVGLRGFERRFPKELSGGQQQRVAIARALAEDGEVLLMDEPFGAIDARNRAVLQDLLLQLWEDGSGGDRTKRKTVVFVTHDLEEAILLSDRVVLMGPGCIAGDFKVPLTRPRDRVRLVSDPRYVRFRSELSKIFFHSEYEEVQSA